MGRKTRAMPEHAPLQEGTLPSIGIVSPSYNQGAFIGAMLNSIERQTLAPSEHIILDGGSKDDSRELIRAYEQRHRFVRAVLEPDEGQVDAINKGLRSSTAEVLTWLNTDDFYSDAGALRAVAEVFAAEPETDVVYARGEFIDTSGKVLREAFVNRHPQTFPETIKHSIGILQPALFFRRGAIERAGLLDGRWNLSLDYELWIRFIEAGLRMRFMDRSIVRAVLHDASKTGGQRGKQYDEIEALTAEHFGFVPLRWLERHAEHLVAGKDGILQSGRDDTDQGAIDAEVDRLQRKWNSSPEAIAAIETCKDEPEVMRTLADLCRRGMLEGMQRVAVTSFTAAYFRQGLNVLASIGRHAPDRFDRVLVYALGLSDSQRRRLASLEGVVVMDYPEGCNEFFDGYFDPKNYSYKCAAIWDAQHTVGEGGTVLWIDAGVALVRPIDEILGLIEREAIFFVDHDDKPGWPFLNSTFTHPEAARAMGATGAELLAPHLCSCLLGYRKGGPKQALIDEAFALSQQPEVVAHSKHPPKEERREFGAMSEQDRAWMDKAFAAPEGISREDVLAHGAYLGHRQDQTIYSILCARHGCSQHSAKRFCWSDDASSKASMANWKSGGEGDLQRSRELPVSMPITALTSHHRGLFDRLDGLPWPRTSETLFVLGNGPSLRDFDFRRLDGFDTVGMNAAYRHWDRINWYPSIYACMDTVVIRSHAHEIERLIRERQSNGIRLFFLRREILELCPGLKEDPSVLFFEDVQRSSSLLDTGMITTGSLSALFGGFLGYRRVGLLGIDCDYVEKLPQAQSAGGHELVITKTPEHNPNYFFDDYQQQGDAYNIPNVHPGFHARSWKAALGLLEAAGVKIVNCNAASKLRAIPMADLDEVLTGAGSETSLPGVSDKPGVIGGAFGRDAKARIEEIDFIADAIGTSHVDDLMVDVGTHHGGSLKPFVEKGWRVLGFEPDPSNRQAVTDRFGTRQRLTIDPRAVSDEVALGVNFFSTDESSGASSLSAFTGGHELSATVDVTTLEIALREHDVEAIRLLKVDAEGFDLMVLRGLPWDRIRPDAIMVEYEDRKTQNLSKDPYTTAEMAEYLESKGYTVVCSEWHPIVRYGIRHDWRRMFHWGSEAPDPQSWGNLIAFRYPADAQAFERLVLDAIRHGELTGAPKRLPVASPQPAANAPATPAQAPPHATPAPVGGAGGFAGQARHLVQRAEHAAHTKAAVLPPEPVVVGAIPWAPKALGAMPFGKHLMLSIGKIGRVYAGRAGVLAIATLACWAAGVGALANGQPLWVGLSLAGFAFVPLFVLVGFIAVTARRQSFENCEALRHASEQGIRRAAAHQWTQQVAASEHTNTSVARAAGLIEALEGRRFSTRMDLERQIRSIEQAAQDAIAQAKEQASKAQREIASTKTAAEEALRAAQAEMHQQIEAAEAKASQQAQRDREAAAAAQKDERARLDEALREQSQAMQEHAAALEEHRQDLKGLAQASQTEMHEALETAQAAGELATETGKDAERAITEHSARTDARFDETENLLSRLRGDAYTQFSRMITPKLEAGIADLGIGLKGGELKYLERKLQVVEGMCEGRLAGSVDDAIARALAAKTWTGSELRVLEIGVLFGIGAIYMHQALAPFYERVHLTLLDPFDGYYGKDHLDPLTGQPVSRAMLERNLRRLCIADDDVTIIDQFSTEETAVASARGESPFAVVIIDGDHSFDGVKADFELYADMVAPGGVLIIDDYGSKDWPEVTAYTKDVIEHDARFKMFAVIGKTAVFRRVEVLAKSQAETKPKSKRNTRKAAATQSGTKNPGTKNPGAKKPAAKTSAKTTPPKNKASEPASDGSLPFSD